GNAGQVVTVGKVFAGERERYLQLREVERSGHHAAGAGTDVRGSHPHIERVGLVSLRPDERSAAHEQLEGLVVELTLADQLESRTGVGSDSARLLFGAAGVGAVALRFGLGRLCRTRRRSGRDRVSTGVDRALEGHLVDLIAGAQL